MNYQEIQEKINNIDWSLDPGITAGLMTNLIMFHGENCFTTDPNCTCEYCELVRKHISLKQKEKKLINLMWDQNNEKFNDCYFSIDYYEQLYENICSLDVDIDKKRIQMKETILNKIK